MTNNKVNILKKEINSREINITEEKILNLLGYKNVAAPLPVSEQIDNLINETLSKAQISGGFAMINDINIDLHNDKIQLLDIEFCTGKIITNSLDNCTSAALFICSVGNEVEYLSKQYLKTEKITEGYIIDIIASEIVESAMDIMQSWLSSDMSMKGLGTTNRYSPGYCDWDVAEQHKLFSFFPDNFCGISLTQSAFMKPLKSVSGIIGIGPKVRKQAYNCKHCDRIDCTFRERSS